MKKILCLALSVLLILSVAPAVMAAGNITVQIDGQSIDFDVPPQIMNGRTMVPLRAIFEALGATVDWNGDTQTVTSEKNGVSISLTINDPSMYVNGSAVTLDSPACIVNGRTLVPVRAISEAFGTSVGWDGATSTVSISTSGNTDPVVTMYAADGRTIEINLDEVEAYKAVGWYEQPVTTMYAADGRTAVVAQSEVEAYKQVGWYDEPVITIYSISEKMTLPVSEADEYLGEGWLTEPIQVLHSSDKRVIYVGVSEVEAYEKVGWQNQDYLKAGYSFNSPEGIKRFINDFYPVVVTATGRYPIEPKTGTYDNKIYIHIVYDWSMISDSSYNVAFSVEQRSQAEDDIIHYMYVLANDIMKRTNCAITIEYVDKALSKYGDRYGARNFEDEYVTAPNGSLMPVRNLTGFHWDD